MEQDRCEETRIGRSLPGSGLRCHRDHRRCNGLELGARQTLGTHQTGSTPPDTAYAFNAKTAAGFATAVSCKHLTWVPTAPASHDGPHTGAASHGLLLIRSRRSPVRTTNDPCVAATPYTLPPVSSRFADTISPLLRDSTVAVPSTPKKWRCLEEPFQSPAARPASQLQLECGGAEFCPALCALRKAHAPRTSPRAGDGRSRPATSGCPRRARRLRRNCPWFGRRSGTPCRSWHA